MIVHTMTHEQMVLEARKDYPALRNKCTEPLRKLRKEHLKDRQGELLHMFTWTSPARKNNWLIVLRFTKATISTYTLAWFPDKQGKLAAVFTSSSGLAYYIDAHVFQRFGERFDPDETPLERLQSFFLENHMYSVEVDAPRGEHCWSVNIGANQGLGRGTWDTRTNIVHWGTFVNHGQLFPNQADSMERMDLERVFMGMSPGQRTHLLNLAEKSDPVVAAFLKEWEGRAA